jgi:hypothetical protein
MRAHYQVQANKTLRGPNGRFIVRGVQMFTYLLVSTETRTYENFRSIYNPPDKGQPAGISEPTYYARICYKDHDYVVEQLRQAWACGVNLIRVDVEPACLYASVPYVDPIDGKTYPADLAMLDDIIDTAAQFGIVVQIQNSNDKQTPYYHVVFLKKLAERYWNRPNVWINPQNEINGTTGDVNNATLWADEMRQYVQALREDVRGMPAGTKYRNPICINPPGWGERIDLVYTTLTTDPVFRDDPNLIIQPHIYPQDGQDDFVTDQLPSSTLRWWQYRNEFAIVIGETGIDNFAGRFDPNLDVGIPSVNLTKWTQMQGFCNDFLTWCDARTKDSVLNGVIGHMWYGYIPGLSSHDDNTMRKQDGTWSTWGGIFRNKYLNP